MYNTQMKELKFTRVVGEIIHLSLRRLTEDSETEFQPFCLSSLCQNRETKKTTHSLRLLTEEDSGEDNRKEST